MMNSFSLFSSFSLRPKARKVLYKNPYTKPFLKVEKQAISQTYS